ncbi:MAG: RagB/SusD family nutrient uptake outer membrane protein, partial [Bacteroidota bacterium]|nr:RagB/SusD family nutrient uptake outer membrane protein [Bacteroidota bacterium]
VGEAHFIRALCYFDLGRAWGGVPLKLTPTEDLASSVGIPRSTLEETYQKVHTDLNTAEDLLPTGINRIRATKNTVYALRARLYLYQQNWAAAEAEATKLINDPGYTLVTPFSAWFKNNVTGTPESIFEIQYSSQNQSAFRAQMQHPTKGGTYRYGPNANLVNLLTNPAIGGTETGRRALIGSVTQSGTTLWYGDLYYRSPATDPTYILRIAEQYLIRAEARTQQGNLAGAIEDLNLIRTRAGLTTFTEIDLPTPEAILLAIEEERRFEFLWEGHRWFDLARTGRAKVVLETLDPKRNVQPFEAKFPIPVDQVLLDNLEQNPGY